MAMPSQVVLDAVARMVAPPGGRTEADLQSDVSLLLVAGGLDLSVDDVVKREVQVGDGTRRRIDVQLGHVIIETKNSLANPHARADAEAQLHGYVATLTREHGQRYAAVLTDGRTWHLYGLGEHALKPIATLTLGGAPEDADKLLSWLDMVLATRQAIIPTAAEIVQRLGSESPSYKLSHLSLRELHDASAGNTEVAVKRQLWAKLLRTAFGAAFDDDVDLFMNHTLLVLTAEAIAHAVIGWDLRSSTLTPRALASGTLFADAQVYGVVESDFFDWVLEVPGGPEFVTSLTHRVAQFDWSQVEHDVLKILYESVIHVDVRRGLGEYYTPDWLAERMVSESVTRPLEQRVLDPSCGSGTFIFHAVRAYLTAADANGMSNAEAVRGATQHVAGIDIHPVAVTLARVTYLLAIGMPRLTADDRDAVTVPIYLGDSMQWEQRPDVFASTGQLIVTTSGTDLVEPQQGTFEEFVDDLRFPEALLADAHEFDRLVSRMADAAISTSNAPDSALIEPVLRNMGIHVSHRQVLRDTFSTMRRFHRQKRDHIWGYYVRNLVRPIWMAQESNRADVLVGNPPWLRYSKMTTAMQRRYKDLAKDRGLLTGGLGASARDLSTLFVARCVELYLADEGEFAFVMPHGVMSRRPHQGFRTGRWASDVARVMVRFRPSWDLDDVTTGFPNVACVVFGQIAPSPVALPDTTVAWHGRLRPIDVPWHIAQARVTVTAGSVVALQSGEAFASEYAQQFRQGAIVVPRILLQVDTIPTVENPLGAGAGRVQVRSHVSTQAKAPWKSLQAIEGNVERRFVHDLLLGESIAPYRLLETAKTVLPLHRDRIMTEAEVAEPEGLSAWWSQVEDLWKKHRVPSEAAALLRRMDYHQQLTRQLPAAQWRVVYTKAGNSLAAARIAGQGVVDHKLYWAAVSSEAEGRYLVAVLNSATLLARVRPLQSRGLFGPRDFDKNVFRVPIPTYSEGDERHRQLVALAEHAEAVAASVAIDGLDSRAARRKINATLQDDGVQQQIEGILEQVLPII